MESLVYLLLTTLKNQILELRRRPGLVILYGIIVVVVLMNFLMPNQAATDAMAGMRLENGEAVLQTGIFVLFAFFVFFYVSKGLDTGGSFFSMAARAAALFASSMNSSIIPSDMALSPLSRR